LAVSLAVSVQPAPQHKCAEESAPQFAASHAQAPLVHASVAAQLPQVPPQPSEPHTLPAQ
jgi:hypothetical protein